MPTSVRDLYARGLDACAVASLAALSNDPEIRSFAREIARWRLVLDQQFARLTGIEAIETQLRGAIQMESSGDKGQLTDRMRVLLQDYERVAMAVQLQIENTALIMENLRRLVESHVRSTDGARIVGDITVGDLQMMLGTILQEVQTLCGDEIARLIADKIRVVIGRLDTGLPAAAAPDA